MAFVHVFAPRKAKVFEGRSRPIVGRQLCQLVCERVSLPQGGPAFHDDGRHYDE